MSDTREETGKWRATCAKRTLLHALADTHSPVDAVDVRRAPATEPGDDV